MMNHGWFARRVIKRWPTVPVAPMTPTLMVGPSGDMLHMMEEGKGEVGANGSAMAIKDGGGACCGLIDLPKPETLTCQFGTNSAAGDHRDCAHASDTTN